jgi:hypothetical protein
MNIALTNFSSLIFNKDKEITNINLASPLQGMKVVNTFTEMKGTLKAVIGTATTSYGLVLGDNIKLNVRLVDCVGYLVNNAIGYLEDDMPRMVKTSNGNSFKVCPECSKPSEKRRNWFKNGSPNTK